MTPPSPPPNDLSRSVLDAMASHIAVLDADGRIVQVNRAWRQFAESNGAHPAQEWVGLDYLSACDAQGSPDDPTPALAVAGIRSVLRGQRDEYTLDYPCHGPREQRWFQLRARRMALPSDAAYCVVSHEDITARMLAEQRLVDARETDALTQLAHRRHAERRWELISERAQRTGAPMALLWVEVAGAGAALDARLKRVAQVLRGCVRHADECAARIGASRLLLITSPSGADAAATRLQALAGPAAPPLGDPGPPWRVGVRIVHPTDGVEPLETHAARAAPL